MSFEEGAEYHDYRQFPDYVCAEQQKGCFRLRQCRGERREALNNVCVFQIEWTDRNGSVHIQPGQMVTGFDYIWSAGVEPLLLSGMNPERGISTATLTFTLELRGTPSAN